MKKVINIEAILEPIPGENPGGEDLRYNPIYDEIKEARRADDSLDRGAWKREIKTADWDKVIKVSVDALTKKSKDLQIAAWLMEALIKTEGFEGLATGLKIILGLLKDYWEFLYPQVEEGDLEFRIAPFELINEKFGSHLKEIPLTDPGSTPGYSWYKYEESRAVGYEADTRNQYGDTDQGKHSKRQEMIAEGKPTAEEFDAAVAKMKRPFYDGLAKSLQECREELKELFTVLDEKFAREAPGLTNFEKALEDCEWVISKIHKEKKALEPGSEPGEEKKDAAMDRGETRKEEKIERVIPVGQSASETDLAEKAVWEEALQMMKSSSIRQGLDRLLGASYSAPSVRQRNRYRLLMAKLCLEADRPDLARPIMEELYALIEELHLDRWESPLWIAEVLDGLYQCLTRGEASDEDRQKARMLLQKICTTDVTRAMVYRS
jgi:type VI secretion system protein ImpA